MERSIIDNDLALPQGNEQDIKPITIGTLAILERLGCSSLPILMGVQQGNLLDNLEDLLLVLYVHVQDEQGIRDIVDKIYSDPESVQKQAIMFGTTKTTDEVAQLLQRLLYDTDRIASSNTESIGKASKSKNAQSLVSSHG